MFNDQKIAFLIFFLSVFHILLKDYRKRKTEISLQKIIKNPFLLSSFYLPNILTKDQGENRVNCDDKMSKRKFNLLKIQRGGNQHSNK